MLFWLTLFFYRYLFYEKIVDDHCFYDMSRCVMNVHVYNLFRVTLFIHNKTPLTTFFINQLINIQGTEMILLCTSEQVHYYAAHPIMDDIWEERPALPLFSLRRIDAVYVCLVQKHHCNASHGEKAFINKLYLAWTEWTETRPKSYKINKNRVYQKVEKLF